MVTFSVFDPEQSMNKEKGRDEFIQREFKCRRTFRRAIYLTLELASV